MATKKSQEPIEIRRKKAASRLALAESTRNAEYNEAVDIFKSMNYSEKDAKIAAKALENKYFEEVRKTILAEAGLEDDISPEEDVDVSVEDDADVVENEDNDNVTLTKDLPEEDVEEMEEDSEELDVDVEDGLVDEEDIVEEPVLEDVNELPGDGEVVEEIEVPGGKLKVIFEPSDASDELEDEDLEEEEEVVDVSSVDTELEGEEEMPKDKEKILAAREAERQKIIASVNKAERRKILSEVINDNVVGKDRGLGQDTAHSGDGRGKPSTNPFKMEDSKKLGVGGPGEEGKVTTLQNSAGNSLEDDPNFLYFDVPTSMLGTVLQQENAKGRKRLEGEYGDLVSKSVEFADAPVPTEGGAGFSEFEVPTQLETTKQRKVTVAAKEEAITLEDVKKDGNLRAAFEFLKNKKYASKVYSTNNDEKTLRQKVANKDCDAYENNEEDVRIVECEDCGGRFVLSQSAIHNEYCPGCEATIEKAVQLVKESEVNKEMWREDYGDELCEAKGNSVTRDTNGDGGFRTSGQMEKEAENEALKKVLAEVKVNEARQKEAFRTAARMIEAGLIDASELEEQANLMLTEGMTAEAMRLYGDQAVKLAQRNKKSVTANTEKRLSKQAGLARNFSVPTQSESADLTKSLANCFSRPNEESWDENGRKLNRR